MDHLTQVITRNGAILRTIVRIAIIVGFILLILKLLSWSMSQLDTHPNLMIGLTILLLVSYALFISIPFVPGIEIALSLMIIKGPDAAIWVYIATVCGLYLSFLVGQFVSYEYLLKIFQDLRLKRASNLLISLQPLTGHQRLELIRGKAPKFIKPFIVEGRYLLMAAALNLPGNAIMGGGGGILMAAGLTRVFFKHLDTVNIVTCCCPNSRCDIDI